MLEIRKAAKLDGYGLGTFRRRGLNAALQHVDAGHVPHPLGKIEDALDSFRLRR